MTHVVELDDKVFHDIKEQCLSFHRVKCTDILKMQQAIMDLPQIPMHYPYHHFIVPAVLLTAAAVLKEKGTEELAEELDTACERSKNVLGGFCGFYGSCGAAVGVGIFFSVFTGATPVSKDNWAAANKATGEALIRISEVSGPRCCKRCSFMALESAAASAEKELGLRFEAGSGLKCHYSNRNLDCKGLECPYYSELKR